jgi:hypothetical protein
MPVFEEGFATALTARTGVHSRPEAGRREQKARGQRASPHFCARCHAPTFVPKPRHPTPGRSTPLSPPMLEAAICHTTCGG